jgi:hypothetical protein
MMPDAELELVLELREAKSYLGDGGCERSSSGGESGRRPWKPEDVRMAQKYTVSRHGCVGVRKLAGGRVWSLLGPWRMIFRAESPRALQPSRAQRPGRSTRLLFQLSTQLRRTCYRYIIRLPQEARIYLGAVRMGCWI